MKLKMCVVGKDVSKSLSPVMHKFIMKRINEDCEYETISIDPLNFKEEIPSILKQYDTLNVTIPYKLDIIPFLNSLEGDAKTFGSCNTIDTRDMKGYNTDGEGFMLMLENASVNVKDKTVLVLGSGGVGRSVIKKIMDAGGKVSAFDLNKKGLAKVHEEFPNFEMLEKVENKPYDIVINCTGVGMHKTEGISPVSKELLSLCNTAVDLIYVPKKSEFLRLAEEAGKKIVNGESMLFYQAYYADCIFLHKEADAKEAKKLFEEYVAY